LPNFVSSFVTGFGNNMLISVGVQETGIFFSISQSDSTETIGQQWVTSPFPLLLSGVGNSWDRTPVVGELWAYPKLVPQNGGDNIGASTSAFLVAMYLFPGQDFSQRYMVKFPVNFLPLPASPDQGVLIVLPQYFRNATNDFFETTSPVPTTYTLVSNLGLLMTAKPFSEQSVLLQSCVNNQTGTHFVTNSSCEELSLTGVLVKPLGWIYLNSGPGRQAIYLCVLSLPADFSFKLSLDENCGSEGKMGLSFGYILSNPSK